MPFLVIHQLLRTCIIDIDVLDEHRANINLDTKKLTFPYLNGKSTIRIVPDESLRKRENEQRISFVEYQTEEGTKIVITQGSEKR